MVDLPIFPKFTPSHHISLWMVEKGEPRLQKTRNRTLGQGCHSACKSPARRCAPERDEAWWSMTKLKKKTPTIRIYSNIKSQLDLAPASQVNSKTRTVARTSSPDTSWDASRSDSRWAWDVHALSEPPNAELRNWKLRWSGFCPAFACGSGRPRFPQFFLVWKMQSCVSANQKDNRTFRWSRTSKRQTATTAENMTSSAQARMSTGISCDFVHSCLCLENGWGTNPSIRPSFTALGQRARSLGTAMKKVPNLFQTRVWF